MNLNFYKLKKVLLVSSVVGFSVSGALLTVIYSQRLAKKDSVAPQSSKAASADCFLTFTVTPPPPDSLECVSLSAAPLSGKAPLQVTFTATASNVTLVSVYKYVFGDGTQLVSTRSELTHTYQEAGSYKASLSIQDNSGNWTAALPACEVDITVTPPPPPPPDLTCLSLIASPISGKFPLAVTFSAAASDSSLVGSYRYFFGDGEFLNTTATTVNHTYKEEGVYNATLRILDKSGNLTAVIASCTKSITVTTTPPPPPDEDLECNDVCNISSDACPTGLKCIGLGASNLCRNPKCSNEADCSCDQVTEEKPPVTEEVPVPQTGNISNTLKVVAAGILMIITGVLVF